MDEIGTITLAPALAKLGGFTQIPNAILRSRTLTARAKLTYAVLLSYAWHSDSCFPGQSRMAADLGGVSLDTVQRGLVELKGAGLVDWTRQGLPARNHYVILEIPDGFDGIVPAKPLVSPDAAPIRDQDAAQLRLLDADAANVRQQDAAPVRQEEYTREEDSVPPSSTPSESQKEPAPAAPGAKPPRRRSETEQLIQAFADEHERVLATPYLIAWARDGQQAKRAITAFGLPACMSAVTAYFRDTSSLLRLGADMPKFVGRIPTLRAGGGRSVNPKTAGNAAAVRAFVEKGRKP